MFDKADDLAARPAPHRESTLDYRAIFDSGPGLCLVLSPDLEIVAVSDAYAQATMTVREEIVGRRLFEVFPDNPADATADGVENLSDSITRVLMMRRPDVMAIQRYDVRRPPAEGGGFEERYWSPLNTPILDEKGEIAWIVHQVQDVTALVRLQTDEASREALAREQEAVIVQLRAANRDLMRAEREIRIQKERAEALLEGAPDPVVIVDHQGGIVMVNARTERVFGYARDELLGQPIGMLIPELSQTAGAGNRPDRQDGPFARAKDAPRDALARRRDGSEFAVDISVSPLSTPRGTLTIGTLRDVTERNHLEQQVRQYQKMEAIGRLTGGVAHDFNNLIGVVTANLDLLIERVQADPDSLELAQEALAGAMRGADLTQRLLAFSRRQPLQPKTFGLSEVLPGMLAMLRRTLPADIAIATKVADRLWPCYCDRSQVEDAILNLAINARDAMPKGGRLLIELGNARLDDDYAARHVEVIAGDYVMLAITDSGAGMSSDVIERAFEPFFTTKPTGKGTGLGLSMVYGFVKQSGGHIKIYSEVGLGTTIRLYLPRSGTEESEADISARSVAPIDRRGRESILIVEDSEELRRAGLRILESLGYKVLEADGPEAAFKLLDSGTKVDLLFTDVVMPGNINGFELAKAARERQPRLKVLLTTGYSEVFLSDGNGHPPGTGLISKPYRKQDLAQRIRELLDGG